jgi:membrane protein
MKGRPGNGSTGRRGAGIEDWLDRRVWKAREEPRRAGGALALRTVRTVLTLARDLADGQLTLRAMSLVYTTLLSIVPLLALSFSALKAFGVADRIQPVLLNVLAPLGDSAAEVAQRIASFVENMNVGVLGALGLALLLYTAVSLVQKVEEALNHVWHVSRPRPLSERFSRYLSVLLVGPLLVFSALGVTATAMNAEAVRQLMSIDALGAAVQTLGKVLPYLLVIAAFSFVYLFIPNARVRLGPALVGGAAGGIVWQSAGWAFATFVAGADKYEAIYSSFAILVLFMIWLYLSWLILLFGASVAFYVQHPEYLYARSGEPRLSNRMRERLALATAALVASRFAEGGGQAMPTAAELTRRLGVPGHVLQPVLDALEQGRILVLSAGDPPRYLPAREPAGVTLAELIDTVRAVGERGFLSPASLPASPSVDDVMERTRHAVRESLQGRTLADLARRDQDLADPDPGRARALADVDNWSALSAEDGPVQR